MSEESLYAVETVSAIIALILSLLSISGIATDSILLSVV
jgi:hypothetical protein